MNAGIVYYIMAFMTHFSDTVLSFALFRMVMNWRNIMAISTIWGTLSYYFRFVLETPFFPVLNLVCFLVLLMVIKRYPVFYAFLVSSITFVVYNAVEVIFSVIVFELGLTSLEQIQASPQHFIFANTSLCTVYILLAYFLKKKDIGFSFIIGNYKKMHVLKPYNFIWAGSLVLVIVLVQFFVSMHLLFLHHLILAVIALAAFAALYFSYKQNKQELKERSLYQPEYGGRMKRKLKGK